MSSVLGFKGGTAALLFYGLPRLSVDLDFDLIKPEAISLERLKKIKAPNTTLFFGRLATESVLPV